MTDLSLDVQGPTQPNNPVEIDFAQFNMGITCLLEDIDFDQEFEGQAPNSTMGSVHSQFVNCQVMINVNVSKT